MIHSKRSWGPEYDQKIFQKFSKSTLKNKQVNKKAFQENLGLEVNPQKFVIALTSDLSPKNGGELLEKVIHGILELDCQILVRAVGTKQFQDMFTSLLEEFPEKIRIIEDREDDLRKIYAASDIVLITNQHDTKTAYEAMAYGVLPVTLPQNTLKDYNPVNESGNSFFALSPSEWGIFAAVIRARENFFFPYDWGNIQKEAMEFVGETKKEEITSEIDNTEKTLHEEPTSEINNTEERDTEEEPYGEYPAAIPAASVVK